MRATPSSRPRIPTPFMVHLGLDGMDCIARGGCVRGGGRGWWGPRGGAAGLSDRGVWVRDVRASLDEGFDRFLLGWFNSEEAVEAGDLDQLHELFPHAAEHEFAVLESRELLVHRQHDANRLRRDVLHGREIHDDQAAI